MSVMNRKYLLIAVLLISQGLVGIIGGLVFASTPRENIIFPGVFIRGTDVGGLSREQAVQLLEKETGEKSRKGNITLQYGKKSWALTWDELGVRLNIPATVDRALQIGRQDGAEIKSLAMFRVRYGKPDLTFEYDINEEKLKSVMNRIASEINIPEKNAGIDLDGESLEISPEKSGKVMWVAPNIQKIKDALGRWDDTPIVLDVSDTRPRITTSDLKGIKESIGFGVTAYSRSDRARAEIITNTVEALDGRILHPGETFSFNQALGPGINERSYHAPVLIQGRVTVDSSGGASQVASALYQAVLYSGLKVKERHAHLAPPEYIKLGQDAVVVYGQQDLKFENNTGCPVYIHASVKGGRVLINLLGVREDGQTLQLITRETETKQPELTGARGSHVEVFRVYYNNGVKRDKELVSEDDYE